MTNATFRTLALAAVVLSAASLRAAEIHSNGTGGGPWGDAATWHDNAVPGPDDSATVSGGDTVSFDRNDDGKLSCRDLYIDPKGALQFKPGGKRVMTIVGPIESYGVIKLDASVSADDLAEIRFTGPAAQRNIKLSKGGALLASGRPGLPGGRHNVALRSQPLPSTRPAAATAAVPPSPPPAAITAFVYGVAGTSIDLRHAHLDGVAVRASKIDNTGAKPNERLNVADCLFTAGGTVALADCDTPSLVNNTLDNTGNPALATTAVAVVRCPLAEIRNNTVVGRYLIGIRGEVQTDTVVSGNNVSDCDTGIRWEGSNDMLKGNTLRGCAVGAIVTSPVGVALEDVTFDNCGTGLGVLSAILQATNLRFANVPKNGVRVQFTKGVATLVNCDVSPEQVKMAPGIRATPEPRVRAMQYCVVRVKGQLPPGAAVNVTTSSPSRPLPKGATDPNVHNAPAVIGSDGLTPLPKSFKSLIVSAWEIGGDGQLTPTPQYDLSVLTVPTDSTGGDPKRVKTVTVKPEPSWYRAEPNDPTPTVEVSLP